MNRDLQDIVYLDVLNEKEQDPIKIEKLAVYVQETLKKLQNDKEIKEKLWMDEAAFKWSEVW